MCGLTACNEPESAPLSSEPSQHILNVIQLEVRAQLGYMGDMGRQTRLSDLPKGTVGIEWEIPPALTSRIQSIVEQIDGEFEGFSCDTHFTETKVGAVSTQVTHVAITCGPKETL